MKRAEVWRDRSFAFSSVWCAGTTHEDFDTAPINDRPDYLDMLGTYPTHAEALSVALSAVGLAPEKEK